MPTVRRRILLSGVGGFLPRSAGIRPNRLEISMISILFNKMKRRLCYALLICVALTGFNFAAPYAAAADTVSDDLPDPGPVDESLWPSGEPDVNAASAIVMDADTGLILYEKDIHAQRYPASITKIMTTLLALENGNLNDIVTTSYDAIWDVDRDSSRIGFDVDESTTLEEMLYGIMLESDNNLSYAVAEYVGGTMENFVEMMNARAVELGCLGTHFANPHGLHEDDHYTTAYDMALIAKAAISDPTFRTITATRTHTIPATNKNVARPIANHHRFIRKTLNYDGCIGGKTGYTDVARTTLVTYARRGDMTLICVVMKCDTGDLSYSDTTKLLDYGFNNYTSYRLDNTVEENPDTAPSLFLEGSNVDSESYSPLRISESTVTLPNSARFEDAERTIVYTPLTTFRRGDNVIGKVYYTYGGKYVGFADIIFSNVRMPSLIDDSLASSLKEQLTPTKALQEEVKEPADLRPVIIGVIVGLAVLLIGLYLIFVEFPHRKRRKAYMERRRKRMEAYRRETEFEDL